MYLFLFKTKKAFCKSSHLKSLLLVVPNFLHMPVVTVCDVWCSRVPASSYQHIDPLGLGVDVQGPSVRPQHHHVLRPQPPHLPLPVCEEDLERDPTGALNTPNYTRMWIFSHILWILLEGGAAESPTPVDPAHLQ